MGCLLFKCMQSGPTTKGSVVFRARYTNDCVCLLSACACVCAGAETKVALLSLFVTCVRSPSFEFFTTACCKDKAFPSLMSCLGTCACQLPTPSLANSRQLNSLPFKRLPR